MKSTRNSRGFAASLVITVVVSVLTLPGSPALAAPAQATFAPVSSIAVSDTTGEKPQSKVWEHQGSWWAVLPSTTLSPSGTWLWKLAADGTWTNVLRLSAATDTQADAKVVGNLVHVFLYGAAPELVSIEYTGGSYQPWALRPTNTSLSLPDSEIATIDVDSTGRMWLATESGTNLNVHYSDAPYTSFTGPITLASGIAADDIGVVTALPSGKIGVLWSNQNTRLFGFKVHTDGADPTAWSADEQPASQSARNVGLGMADDHLNVAVAADGTLYAAVKTSYDTAGETKIALLVRRPSGTWDNLYEVDQAGTRAIVLLNEQEGSVRVVYTSSEGFNDIVMKTSSTSSISFGPRQTLITGGVNDVTSTKQNWTGKVLILASSSTTALGGFIDVTGTPANTAPVATNGTLAVTQDTPASGTLQATDADSDPLTYSIVANGSKGTAVVTNASTGAYTYTPNAGATGADSFTFKANDGTADSNTATVNVTITATPSSFVGHWRADEGSGTTLLDSSGTGNNATVFGNTTWVPGKIGQAVSFDGTGDYATVADNAGLDLTNAITMATWVRPGRFATQELIAKSTNGSVNGYDLALATSGTATTSSRPFVRFNQLATPADVFRVSAVSTYPIDGTWMHVAATYDGTTIRLYVNGVEERSLVANVAIATNTLPLSIGAESNGARALQGAMDDVRLYSRALTATEISALAHPNTAPVATNGNLAVTQDTPASGTLQATDADTNPLTYSIVGNGSKGTAVVTNASTGAYTYTPNAGATGTDSFTFKANDGTVDSNTATVNVTITATPPTFIGHWMADEGSGTTLLDSSGTGNNATLSGATAWIPGKVGLAIRFNGGTADYASVGSNPSLNITNAITLATWVRSERNVTTDLIKKVGTAGGYELSLADVTSPAGQKFFVRLNQATTGDTYRLNSITSYPANGATWMHVAATYDGTNIRLYVNGVQEASMPAGISIGSSTNGLGIGGLFGGTRTLMGAMDDIRLYSRALSASEISALATVAPPPNTAPVATNGTLAVTQDTPASGTLQATDADSDPLTYSIVANGSKGTAVVTNASTGAYTYTPNAGATGADSFTFKANDGTADSNTATVNVTITATPSTFIGHWRADEGSGTTLLDSSGTGNTATLSGNPTWVAGRIGLNAIRFDGAGDYATVADNAGLDLTSAVTMATWIRPEKVATQSLLNKAIFGTTDGYELSLSAGNKVFVRFNQLTSGDLFRVNSTTNYPTNSAMWMHVAATYDGISIRLYVNGVEEGLIAGTTIAANSRPFTIGDQSDGVAGREFQGAMDDIRLYSRALSAPEISALASVAPPNTAPVATNGTLAVTQNTPASDTLQASDADSNPLTCSIVSNGTKGTAVVTNASTGAYTYTPNAGATGADSFTFKANDGTVDSNVATVTVTISSGTHAVSLNGSNQYIRFGQASGLGASQLTLELWFKRTGAGVGTSSGSGGVTAIPLLTKGRAEADGSNLDMNYFLGIDSASGVLTADFEDMATGANHPVAGTTVVSSDVWHHAAATYDGTTWRLYLDGVLDKAETEGAFAPRSDSIQHAALGTAMTSTGVAAGFFQGAIDEARVWNSARTQAQINSAKDADLLSAPGMIGRWGLNEGAGTTAFDSSGSDINGTLTNGPTWVEGFVVPPPGPNAPTVNAPVNGGTAISTSPTLDVSVSDPANGPLTVTFRGRPKASGLFQTIATNTSVPSGTSTTALWAGLGAGQEFEWFVMVDNGASVTTGPTWTFTTINGTDPVLVGAGDIAKCDSLGDEATGDIVEGISGTVFTAGDNVYQDGTAAEFTNCYDPSWGSFKGRTRPTPGNHDWNTGNLNGYNGYYGSNATDGDGKSYYGYDVGALWHVTVLDTECAQPAVGGCDVGSPQELWLRADLAAHADDNVIVIWHKPRFSSGATNLLALQTFYEDIYDAGVDILLVGHDHVYERFAPSDPAGVADPTYGVRQFTVGTGGAEHHSFATTRSTSQVRNSDTWGVMKFTLHSSSYDWKFLPIDGATFTDSGTAFTHEAPPNGSPVIDSASIDQAAPTTAQTLTVTVTSHDPDADPVTYAYQWQKDTGTGFLPIAGATGSTLDLSTAGNGSRGDRIRVVVTPNDGTVDGAPATTSPVTIADTAPVATVSLDDPTPSTNAVLTATATGSDADGDAVTFTYVWKVNGTTVKTTTGSASLTDTLDLSQAGNGDTGQTVSVTVTPNDGTLAGTPVVDSAVVQATAPAAPTGVVVSVTPTSVELDWANNLPTDLAGYDVYRSGAPEGPYLRLNNLLLTTSAFSDATAPIGSVSYYRITAVNSSGSESVPAQASATRKVGFRGVSTAATKGATGLTIGTPATTQPGDVLIAVLDVHGVPTVTAPIVTGQVTGWTLIRDTVNGSAMHQLTYWKVVAAGDPTSYRWTFSTSQVAAGAILAYRGVDVNSPVEIHDASSAVNSKQITAPSVTSVYQGGLVLGLFGIAQQGTVTPPNAMFERAEIAAAGKTKIVCEIADAILQAAGPTGARTASASKTGANIGQIIVLRPAIG